MQEYFSQNICCIVHVLLYSSLYLCRAQEDVDKLLTSQLGPRERDIVRLHYGVGRQDGSVMSLESISHRYGVSRERVRQLETAAMRKLQIKSREQGLDRYLHSM